MKKFTLPVAIICCYFFLGLYLLKYYQYHINPDGISYINVALRYINGNFSDAINGYWSPLISWLIIPLLKLQTHPLLSIRIVNLMAGGILAILVYRLISESRSNKYLVFLAMFSVGILSLEFALNGPLVPDFITVVIAINFFFLLCKKRYFTDKKVMFLVGLTGAVGFYCKSYFLFFFLIGITAYNVMAILLDRESYRKVLFAYLVSVFTFFMLCSPWILLISLKYKAFTYSTSSSYNLNLIGPDYSKPPSFDIIQPFYTDGLIEPPYQDSLSINDDVSFMEESSWSPFENKENFIHYVNIVKKNINDLYKYLSTLYFIPILVFFYAIYQAIKENRGNKNIINSPYLVVPILTTIYVLGYTIVFIRDRYIWIIPVTTLILLCSIAGKAFVQRKFWQYMTAISFLLLLTTAPLYELSKYKSYPGKNYYETSMALEKYNLKNARVASNTNRNFMIYICYYLECKNYGIPKAKNSKQYLEKELLEKNIDYYFYWSKKVPDLPESLVNVGIFKDAGLYIYRVDR